MAIDQHKNDGLLDDPHVNDTFARKMKAVLADLRGHGGQWYVTECYRPKERQRFLYSKGRSTATLRKAGFTDAEIKKYRADGALASSGRVTNVLTSMHTKGLACDVVPIINGKLDWGADADVWALVGSSAKAHGLTWGGSWKMRDMPHCELDV